MQTKAAKRQEEEEKDELHTQQMQMITQATRTVNRRITDLSPYFVFDFARRDQSIEAREHVHVQTYTEEKNFRKRKEHEAITQLFDDKKNRENKNMYIERKRCEQRQRAEQKKISSWLRLIKHTSKGKEREGKMGSKAEHVDDAFMRRKIQAEKKGTRDTPAR